jgi:glycosyltransferase involved in cell wall biosynthesis
MDRASLLEQTLESILEQANEEVEIVVVDGGSKDHTSDVVEEFRRKFANTKYLGLDEKGGVDQDFAKAVALADGKYCWLFSDDDLLLPGAIQAVLNAIDCEYSLIIVNSEVRGSSLDILVEERRLKFYEDREYLQAEFERLFIETANYLSFIGAVVIKKDLWSSRRISDYFNTEFVHVGVIFQEPIPGKTLVIANPYISIRYGNAQWSSRSIDIWMHKWPDLIWSFPLIHDRAKKKVGKGKSKSWQRLNTLLVLRAQGIYGIDEFRIWLQPTSGSTLQKGLMMLVANLPGYLLNFLAVIYFQLFSPSSGITLYDLRNSRYYYRKLLDHTSANQNPN